jgi:glycosyltransferase involved in cell wall biosynthesis
VCSFGVVGSAKLNHEVFEAWSRSRLADRENCRLVFVGDGDSSPYARALQQLVEQGNAKSTVSITGYVENAVYRKYMEAADLAVQLRARSRGETSRALLDCMAHGVPVVANAHGAIAELPHDALYVIPESAASEEIARALTDLFENPGRREALIEGGYRHLTAHHAPDDVARRYRDAIEAFAASDSRARQRKLVRSIGALPNAPKSTDRDLGEVARCIAENHRPLSQRQLLVDVSTLVRADGKTGIQRVVRNTLRQLLRIPLDDLRVEPVYRSGSAYRYARSFTAAALGWAETPMDDDAVDLGTGDVFLGLDLDAGIDDEGRAWIRHAADRGVRRYFVVYDVLPLICPHRFPAEFVTIFRNWIETVVPLASGFVCISESVADELAQWVDGRGDGPGIGHFHLGADLDSGPAELRPELDEAPVLDALGNRPFFLMVGTLEPRKGHSLVLAALERLWARNVDVGLVVVGRRGWMVETLTRRLQQHPEAGKRLRWIDHASDGMLLELYGRAAALIQASEAEGFGLPLVEAARHGTLLIARDLPVFREVAGDHAFYFVDSEPEGLASRLAEWLSLRERGGVPRTDGMTWLTWEESAKQLLDVVLHERWKHRIGLDERSEVSPALTPLPTPG